MLLLFQPWNSLMFPQTKSYVEGQHAEETESELSLPAEDSPSAAGPACLGGHSQKIQAADCKSQAARSQRACRRPRPGSAEAPTPLGVPGPTLLKCDSAALHTEKRDAFCPCSFFPSSLIHPTCPTAPPGAHTLHTHTHLTQRATRI